MEYEKMFSSFHSHSTKMLHANCLAPPASLSSVPALSQPPLQSAASLKCDHTQFSAGTLEASAEPYASFADNFDLSLLPQDCDTLSATKSTPTSGYPSAGVAPLTPQTPQTPTTPPQIKVEYNWPPCPLPVDAIKQEHRHNYRGYMSSNCSQRQLIPPAVFPHLYPSPQSSPAQSDLAFPPNVPPSGSYDPFSSSSRTSLYGACSPCPSLDVAAIKQEQLHILPPSPPESNCETPSPHSSCADIKSEPFDSDVETLIDLNSLLEQAKTSASLPRPSAVSSAPHPSPSQPPEASQPAQPVQPAQPALPSQPAQPAQPPQPSQSPQNHQLLREYLEDTSFQKRHNLKPLALESFIGGLEAVRGDIEPVISLALEHAKREADATCVKLQISQDPAAWSPTQVLAWLRSTILQFKLPPIDNLETKFCEDGAALMLLSEEEFLRRTPECGSTLHAQLEIWKLAYSGDYQSNVSTTIAQQQPQQTAPTESNACSALQQEQQQQQQQEQQQVSRVWNSECVPSAFDMVLEEESEDDEDFLSATNASTLIALTNGPTSVQTEAGPEANASSTNNVTAGTATATVAAVAAAAAAAVAVATKRTGCGTVSRSSGSHIHLWQFLKELLAAPHMNGTAIRWIDRSKGIFKIEDSVRVAKLWGKRKNRPAMNYDKLSRSIRQYYKKGIMKKTERSQRLVYQFCQPYHM